MEPKKAPIELNGDFCSFQQNRQAMIGCETVVWGSHNYKRLREHQISVPANKDADGCDIKKNARRQEM
jgi:hypothetical protein